MNLRICLLNEGDKLNDKQISYILYLLELDTNADENWRRFEQRFGFYMQAVDLDSYRCKKVATLLSFAGPNAI